MDPQEQKISELINTLTKIALADDKITTEEAKILDSVQISVLLYDQALDNALDDGVIDESEKGLLTALKNKILEEAADILNVSEGISDKELKLLQVILNKFQ